MDNQLIKISDIIMRHLNKRYPVAFNQIGLTQDNIISILKKKENLLTNKENLTHIINIIDNIVKNKLNGPNTKLNNINTNNLTTDASTTIPYDKFINQQLDVKTEPSFKLNPRDNETIINDINMDTNNFSSYNEKNILDERMNTNYELSNDNHEIYLVIDSKNRDYDKFNTPNNYDIDLSDEALTNIYSIKLIDVILKDISYLNSNNIPYLILKIGGIPNVNHNKNIGFSDYLQNSFILKYYKKQNGFRYYNNLNILKSYKTSFSINKINVAFYLPDGTLLDFNEDNDLNSTVSLLTFKLSFG